jgi:hypothetical protein
MVKVYGASDDLVEIDNSEYAEDEIGCFEQDVCVWFDDGTIIRIGYSKPELAVWYIVVENTGDAVYALTVCDDENGDIYSDVFEIDAEVLGHKLIEQKAD